MRYLIILTAAAKRLSPTTFACESAFVEHLRTLKHELGGHFDEIVVAMAEMNDAQFDQWKGGTAVIDEAREHIRFEPLFPWRCSNLEFLSAAPQALKTLNALVASADLVHSHASYDLFRPVEMWASAISVLRHKKLMAITDMDNRRDAEMNYRLGRWSKKSYLVCKYVYDPIRDLQQRALVRFADLVLFKELQQVEDYGRGAPHVRLFLDPNFALEHVAPPAVLEDKERRLRDGTRPLRALYFGRLVAYKGVDRMIEAVAVARAAGASVTLSIMGQGDQEEALRVLVRERGLADVVSFVEPRPYGPQFFEVLRSHDVMLACPLSADTPRSAWDALASGLPLLAFDTPFYAGLGKLTGAVDVTPWPEAAPLGHRLAELAAHKDELVPKMHRAVKAARENTSDDWMRRRVSWVEELFGSSAATRPSGSA